MKIVYTQHAQEMLAYRKIRKSFIKQCIANPDKKLTGRNNSLIFLKDFGINYLKIIASEEKMRVVIITAYWLAKKRIKT